MEKFREELKKFLNKEDRFALYIGAEITEIGEGSARAVMPIGENHLNGVKVVQGGAIFTLGDFVFAAASNSYGTRTASTSCEIHFLRPGSGKALFAEARKIHHGSKTCLYDIEITNDTGTLVAKMTISGFLFEGESVLDTWKKLTENQK